MIKSDAKLKKLSSAFENRNRKLVREAIDMLRDEQPFEGVIGLLTSLYDRSTESEIKLAVENFMNDLKDQSAAPEIITEINHGWKSETTRMLVASCWQSGLDYSNYALDLAGIFISSDYATAIECLTVIEESVPNIPKNIRNKILVLVESKVDSLNPDMNKLAQALSTVLQG